MAAPHPPGQTKKLFTLTVDDDTEANTRLDRFMEDGSRGEGGVFRIPFRALHLHLECCQNSRFFSHPSIPDFLNNYGPQIHQLHTSYMFARIEGLEDERLEDYRRHELSFYGALPHLSHLTTHTLGSNVPSLEPPSFLHPLHSLHITSVVRYSNTTGSPFLSNCQNLANLQLPMEFLPALGPYFNSRAPDPRKLKIFLISSIHTEEICERLFEAEDGTLLLEQLAAADGRISIGNFPISVLEEAVLHFRAQPDSLARFGKCIIQLWDFSTFLSQVPLPNCRDLTIDPNCFPVGSLRIEDFSKTDSWPALREITIVDMNVRGPDRSDIGRFLLGSSRTRPSVERLDFDLEVAFLCSEEALRKLPNLRTLTLKVSEGSVELLRSLLRLLPTTAPNVLFLSIWFYGRLGVEDEEGLSPLRQLKGKRRVEQLHLCFYIPCTHIYIYLSKTFFSLEVASYSLDE
jgi:hypothetical protein